MISYVFPCAFSLRSVNTWVEIIDITSIDVRLNSSRQHHEPELAIPFKNRVIVKVLILSEKLYTIRGLARALARSFTTSVFPTPAGPYIETPRHRLNEFKIVI